MTPVRVAVLEDDPIMRDNILLPGLARFGFDSVGFASILALKHHLATGPVEVVVLDIGLPDGSGFSVAREIREQQPATGIIILTSRAEGADHVRGLSEGADAYLTKPVDIAVLAATVHSVLRRIGTAAAPAVASAAGWRLSADEWCLVSPAGASAALTAGERRLCRRLLLTPGQLVPREAMIEAVTDNVHDFDAHRLDSMIHRLRSKALAQCGQALPLKAVQGRGYILMG